MSVIALIPAYNAASTIGDVVRDMPMDAVSEIAIVDDGSTDNTYELICKFGDRVTPLRHAKNRGYGGAQKTLYSYALTTNHSVFVNLNADGGHLPQEVPKMIAPLLDNRCDVVLGSRTVGVVQASRPILGSQVLAASLGLGGMPAYKFVFHTLLTAIQNFCYRAHFDSWHSGYRAINRTVLEQVPFLDLTEWYEYDTEFLICMARDRVSFEEVPVSVCYRDDVGSSAPVFGYGWKILKAALRYRFGRTKARTVIPAANIPKAA